MLEMAHPTRRVFKHHGLIESVPSSEQAVETETLWVPPVLRTVATQGDGVPELVGAIARHQAHLEATGEWHDRDRARLQAELDLLIQGNLVTRWRQEVSDTQYQEILDTLVARQISPHQAVKALLDGGQST
jgi:LAO/AO transport system kinase